MGEFSVSAADGPSKTEGLTYLGRVADGDLVKSSEGFAQRADLAGGEELHGKRETSVND